MFYTHVPCAVICDECDSPGVYMIAEVRWINEEFLCGPCYRKRPQAKWSVRPAMMKVSAVRVRHGTSK